MLSYHGYATIHIPQTVIDTSKHFQANNIANQLSATALNNSIVNVRANIFYLKAVLPLCNNY